jgi:hypothetical protein
MTLSSDSYQLFYELRAPKALKFEPLTRFDVVTDQSVEGTRLRLTKRRDEGDFVIFSFSCLIFAGESRRAMIVHTDGQPSQVFRLKITRKPWPADWSNWQQPDYIEKTDAVWTFMHDLKEHDRSTNIPPNCFELRFKITKWNSP